jgi:DNA-binding Lrp family transcriptional regulator
MLSLSDNEFSVLSFLVRNFTERLTIRNIAKRLGFSAAGVFNILKKLEKQNIVTGQKFGTGLFYAVNFGNRVAEHLAGIVLIYSEEKQDKDIADKSKHSKAAIFDMSANRKAISEHDQKSSISDKKTLLIVTDNVSVSEINIPNINVISKTEDELIDSFRKNDNDTMQILKKGIVLHGEDVIIKAIKNSIQRF